MKDNLTAIKMNLNLLIKRICDMKFSDIVNYKLEQMLNEINKKIYELANLIEELEEN